MNSMPNEEMLYDYQRAMARRHLALLLKRSITCDRSETGIGKTIAILRGLWLLLQEIPQLKFLAICPKSVRSHWRLWVDAFGLGGACRGVFGWEEMKLGLCPHLYDRRRWLFPKSVIIFDEAHRAKSHKSLNARMVKAARMQGHYVALLSATLIQSPLDLSGLSFPLGLVAHPKYWFRFAQQFGAGLNRWRGYDDFSSPAQREALHALLDKVSVRVRKAEVTPSMCISQVDLLDSSAFLAIRSAYAEMEREIAQLEAKQAAAVQIITERLRARQRVEFLKVSLFCDLAREHLEEGSKVVLFLNFTQSINAAERIFAEMGIATGRITGDISQLERDLAVAGFNGEALGVLLCNIAAGGEGLSLGDSTGNKARVSLLSPPESATVLVQALGRIDRITNRSVGLNRLIFVAGTIEEKVYRNVARKIKNIAEINDGDLVAR